MVWPANGYTRSVETEVGLKTISVKITRGRPQREVTSPLMWSLIVKELLCGLTDLSVPCQEYTDDIVVYARGKFQSILCDVIQSINFMS